MNNDYSKHDAIKIFQVILAICMAFILTFAYLLLPNGDSLDLSRFSELLENMIPEAIVILIAVPVFYYLVYRTGLSFEHGLMRLSERIDQLDRPSSRNENNVTHSPPSALNTIEEIFERSFAESEDITASRLQNNNQDVLIIVDYQNDFITGSMVLPNAEQLLKPLNQAISIAEKQGMLIIFTRDWHSKDHLSFIENGGKWPQHCIANTFGSELHKELIMPKNKIVIDFGVDEISRGFSPYENKILGQLISSPSIRTVYVAGIALEHCVLATCLDTAKKGKEVVALEDAIVSVGNGNELRSVWKKLEELGIYKKTVVGLYTD